jgi:uncharacterized protein YifE (UPF0438 family)
MVYLQRRPFAFHCTTSIFPQEEYDALCEYGNWLEALSRGLIQPVTVEQKHFLQVDRDETEPKTLFERAWLRLKGRREFEHAPLPTSVPAEDYGIVEWDQDRCWW